jgi:hypothetical protein
MPGDGSRTRRRGARRRMTGSPGSCWSTTLAGSRWWTISSNVSPTSKESRSPAKASGISASGGQAAGGAKNSSAMLSGSLNDRADP